MANKTINTRIRLKYDSFANWNTNNPLLLEGEVAIAHLGPSTGTSTTPDNGTHPVLFKVGPGNFNSLPWVSGLAADVYAWAKKETPDWTDFPALPLIVEDKDTGKFVTGVAYSNNKLTITRANVVAADIADAPWLTTQSNDFGKVSTNAGDIEADAIHDTIKIVGDGAIISTAASGDTLTISADLSDYALKTELPTELGVMSVAGAEAIEVDNADDANPVVKLKLDAAPGNVVFEQSNSGLKASVDLSEYRKIADDEDTKYGIVYDSATRKIKLTNDATQAEIDASDFIKDGMIVSVDVVNEDDQKKQGRFLKIVWNTADLDDDDVVTYVNLSDLIDVYTADETSLELKENKFSIKDSGVTTAKIADENVTKNKLDSDVQDSLGKADSAIQKIIASYGPGGIEIGNNPNNEGHDVWNISLEQDLYDQIP